MDFSNPAFTGAVVGMAVGLLDYVIIMGVIGKVLSRSAGNSDSDGDTVSEEGRAKVRQSMRLIKPAVLFGSFVIFPVTGYFVGKQFAS